MFKPEYLLDYAVLFGYSETVKMVAKRLQRMGKNRDISYIMAKKLVAATLP